MRPRDGGTPRSLTREAEHVYLGPVTWTPDSRAVLYTAAGKMHLASLDETPQRTIEFVADLPVARWRGLRRPEIPRPGEWKRARGIVGPELSPDGTRIVFAALGDMWVLSAQGGTPERLTHTPLTEELVPTWSPDGRRVVFAVIAPGTEPKVKVLEVDAPEVVRDAPVHGLSFFQAAGLHLTWSPDGRRLAYLMGGRVTLTDLESGDTRIVAGATRHGGIDAVLGWTPNGDSIVFSTQRLELPGGLFGNRSVRKVWQVSADSGVADELPAPGEYSLRAAWSADLSRAAYSVAGRGYHVRIGGSETPTLIPDAAPYSFSWSHDGRYLLYLSGDQLRLQDLERDVVRTVDAALQYQVPAAPPSVLVRNVRIIDGTGAAPSAPSDLLISDGRIQEIEPAGSIEPHPEAEEIDGAGSVLLPGLFNTHSHQSHMRPCLSAQVYNGVLALRDPGMDADGMQSQRERAEAGEIIAPRIFMTGGFVVAEIGMGRTNMRAVDVSDAESVTGVIAGLAALGADYIKPYFRNPVLDARVLEAAHVQRIPVTSHYLFAASLARGLDGKEHSHLYYRDFTAIYYDDVLAALRAADVCVTPTLLTYPVNNMPGRSLVLPLDSSLVDDVALRTFYPPSVLDGAWEALRRPISERALETLRTREQIDLENARRLRDAGVRMATGTDVPPPWDEVGPHWEMELLVKAGLSPLEAIRAATLDAARCLGVENELGSVEVGKIADLIIVDGNPAANIRDTRRITRVILGGRPYSREDILEHVRRASLN
jgi:imidazolonepropionase-like amidohydrolase